MEKRATTKLTEIKVFSIFLRKSHWAKENFLANSSNKSVIIESLAHVKEIGVQYINWYHLMNIYIKNKLIRNYRSCTINYLIDHITKCLDMKIEHNCNNMAAAGQKF